MLKTLNYIFDPNLLAFVSALKKIKDERERMTRNGIGDIQNFDGQHPCHQSQTKWLSGLRCNKIEHDKHC